MTGLWIGLWIAFAGGLGAVARYLIDFAITTRTETRLPVGTLSINISGSLLLGLLIGAGPALGSDALHIAGIGFLGGFTTFSTASVELVQLVHAGRGRAAAGLALGMLGASLAAAWIGLVLGAAVAG